MDISNIDNICRACMFKNENLLSIFDIQIADNNSIQMAEFLNNLTSIEITKDDGLPQQVCVCCIDTICKIYNFIQMCTESDLSLRMHHNNATEDLCNESNTSSDLSNEETSTLGTTSDWVTATIILNNEGDNVKTEAHLLKEKIREESSNHCEKYEELVENKLVHDSNRSYECKKCSQCFPNKKLFSVHMRLHKVQDKHVCKVCGQTFGYSYLLNQHSYKHKDEKPFPCSKCNKGCLTAESLRRHMKIHEDGYKRKIHACSICGKEFEYPSFLSEHMKNHTGEKPFLCSICGKGFRQRGALSYHVRSHTGYKPHTCEICNNNFTSRSVLRVHMRRHTDERPYICDICGAGFRQSTDMKRHRSNHSGDKHVLCTICGKQMSTTGQLTVHLRSHTGEKPFGCKVCQKAFTTNTMLVKHQRIHTGERPYTCKICGRSFNQSSTLKTHQMVHIKNNLLSNSGNLKNEDVDSIPQIRSKIKSEALLALPSHIPPVTIPL
ncbi:hypothetical protein RN001_007688 [Aquatica leii]|uniref:Uncharacterized protein n=1 Tax=Aquatica leii TaxID=1421715 RepID=A0AAN7SFN2_9COLE|nr:hypothetical protein RN001_007688 [Aquatica leii]